MGGGGGLTLIQKKGTFLINLGNFSGISTCCQGHGGGAAQSQNFRELFCSNYNIMNFFPVIFQCHRGEGGGGGQKCQGMSMAGGGEGYRSLQKMSVVIYEQPLSGSHFKVNSGYCFLLQLK